MKDTIYRQDAIDAIHCDITVTGRQNAELVAATIGTFADRIKALPSAQPDVPDTNVGDMISRQNLMEKLNELCDKKCPYNEPTKAIGACCSFCAIDDVIEIVQNLPSAEPVIRCKDCKHMIINEKHEAKPMICCFTKMCGTTEPDWFCADGERREDGLN